MKHSRWVFGFLGLLSNFLTGPAWTDNTPAVPRIDGVVMKKLQPQVSDAAIIWYDDFDGIKKKYSESMGGLYYRKAFGRKGGELVGQNKLPQGGDEDLVGIVPPALKCVKNGHQN